MSAPTYTTDLTPITDAESGTWVEFTGWTLGDVPIPESDFFIEGIGCHSSDTNRKTGMLSGGFDNGSDLSGSFGAGFCFFGWSVVLPGNGMNTYASDGIRQVIGETASAYTWWTVGGSDYGRNPYGGWQNTVVDPTNGDGTAVGGGHTGTYQFFGFAFDLTSTIEKGSPLGWDAQHYGRGELRFWLGDDVGGGHSVFSAMSAENDIGINRWGLFQAEGTGYLWKGLMSFGQSGTPCWFEDSNVSITIDDTPVTYADFNRIEINGTGSTVIWNNISISAVNPGGLAVGNFEMIENPTTMDKTGCVFTDMGTFIYLSNAVIATTTYRRCDLVTTGGATFSGCTFDDTTATRAVYAATGTEAGKISNSEFISGGTGYGLEVDGAVDDFILSNVTWTGYAAQGGTTTDRAIHILATTGTVTITVSGGTTPSYDTDGATVVISDDVVNSVTIRDSGQNLIENCAVAVFLDSDDSELANEFTTGTGKVTFSCPVSSAFTIRARKNSPGETRYFPATQLGNSGGAGVDLSIALVEDTIA